MKKPRPDVEALVANSRMLMWDVATSTPRTAVIVAAAVLDDLLNNILAARMIKTSKFHADAMKDRALPFARRIDLCYSLGLISKGEMLDLHIIRRIRNDVAHTWRPVSLRDCSFSSRFKTLDIAKRFWRIVGKGPSGSRLWFLSGWVILANRLTLRLQQTEPAIEATEFSSDEPIVFGGGSAPHDQRLTNRLSRRRPLKRFR